MVFAIIMDLILLDNNQEVVFGIMFGIIHGTFLIALIVLIILTKVIYGIVVYL